ncbi:MAG: ABC transporter permease [Chloroflexota bacterium]|nr:ABC transporter permease [Chloroflexota bacterium]
MTAATGTFDPTILATRRSSFARVRSMLRGDPLALLGLALISLFVFLAIFGPMIAPSPGSGAGVIDVEHRLAAPSAAHIFGTDELGRDVLTRVILGARPTLSIALVVVSLAVLLGVPLGAIAGYNRGWLDAVIMRVADLFLAFPPLLLAMAIVAALGAGIEHAALALAVAWWPWYTRIARGTAVSLRERPFIDAARTMGLPNRTIVLRHIVPNSLTPIVVQAMLDMGTVILAAGGLAFLGLGARPPFPDWGLMVASGRDKILSDWWLSTLPGVAIFAATLGFTLLGDFLVRALDPRQN